MLFYSYKEAFFGRVDVWRSAFERFLQTPPRSIKDNVALRNVLAFLMEGMAWMCPRGLNVFAAATEVRMRVSVFCAVAETRGQHAS